MSACARAAARIREVVAGSPLPEDRLHAEDTLAWLLRLEPGASTALQLAALAHDIERSLPPRVRREEYPDYEAFKSAHARRSARLADRVLAACGVAPATRAEVRRLVRRHERGGTPAADLLRDADSISFFAVNLPHYFRREPRGEVLRRCTWGCRRLSPGRRQLVASLEYPCQELADLVHAALARVQGAGEGRPGGRALDGASLRLE